MKKFGLIGHPIAHSLSPALFNAAFNGKYSYDLIEEKDFEKAYERFLEEYDAINVTAPFKEKAFLMADSSDNDCQAIGAANILHKDDTDGLVSAYNSDVDGVTGALAPYRKTGIKTPMALIVGCGGAAMAAAYATWHHMGYDTFIINRNAAKAQKFVDRLKSKGYTYRIHAAGLECFAELFRQADIIIYNLPVVIPAIDGLSRRDIRGTAFWKKSQEKVILEANYKNPAFTSDLVEKMRRVNPRLKYISGKEWLLHQAIGAYRRFVSDIPDIDAMRAVIE